MKSAKLLLTLLGDLFKQKKTTNQPFFSELIILSFFKENKFFSCANFSFYDFFLQNEDFKMNVSNSLLDMDTFIVVIVEPYFYIGFFLRVNIVTPLSF